MKIELNASRLKLNEKKKLCRNNLKELFYLIETPKRASYAR